MVLVNIYDVFSVAHVGVYFVLLHLAWARHDSLHWAHVCVCCAVLSYYSFSCACIAHNNTHCQTFCRHLHDVAFRQVLTLTFGHPVSTLVPGHVLSHHKHTESSRDVMRTSKLQYEWHWLNLLLFQPTVAWDVFKVDVRYLSLQRTMNTGYFWRTGLEWCLLLTTHGALLYMHWRKFFLYVYLPHLFAQWAIVTMNLLQHDGCHARSSDDTPYLNRNPARQFTGSRVSQLRHDDCHVRSSDDTPYLKVNTARNFTGRALNLLTFNNGFHSIHHMYPSMHWSTLREQHDLKVAPHIHPALIQPSLVAYLYRTFVFPGKRVDYLGRPVVFAKGQPGVDEDWTIEHAPPGLALRDYDVDMDVAKHVARAVLRGRLDRHHAATG